jgi:DNA-binding NarL/FixJ family response regulator
MGDNEGACIPTIDPAATQLEPRNACRDVDLSCIAEGRRAEGDGFIALIESRLFLLDCIRRSLQSAFSLPIVTYATVSELEREFGNASAQVVILSLRQGSNEESAKACRVLSELLPSARIIALAHKTDADLARTVIGQGAKGYIPITTEFEIAVGVVRFVLAGGTYFPADCLLATDQLGFSASKTLPGLGILGSRELSVVRAIQKGKSNKVIAYELNMRESTVKVHVRNIMKKWKANNRMDVAIKAQTLLDTTT